MNTTKPIQTLRRRRAGIIIQAIAQPFFDIGAHIGPDILRAGATFLQMRGQEARGAQHLKGFIPAGAIRVCGFRRAKHGRNGAGAVGEDFEDLDWRKLDPRQYDPRRIIREALTEDLDFSAEKNALRETAAAATAAVAPAMIS